MNEADYQEEVMDAYRRAGREELVRRRERLRRVMRRGDFDDDQEHEVKHTMIFL